MKTIKSVLELSLQRGDRSEAPQGNKAQEIMLDIRRRELYIVSVSGPVWLSFPEPVQKGLWDFFREEHGQAK